MTRMTTQRETRFARGTAGVIGFLLVALGVWALAGPRSFFDAIAIFPPYNQHFLQDIGAFQIGLGAVLLLALRAPANGLGVALLGVGVGSAAHTLSHVIGIGLGGRPAADIPTFLVLTAALLAAGWSQWRANREGAASQP